MSENKRRSSYVHPKIQGAIVRRLVLYWIAFVAATCLVTLVLQYLMDPLQSTSDWSHSFRVTVASFLVGSVCLIPAFILDSIKLSHRFVGPIVRLQTLIREVGRSEVEPMRVRAGDFWHSLFRDFNEMLDRLPQQAAEETSECEPLREPVESSAP